MNFYDSDFIIDPVLLFIMSDKRGIFIKFSHLHLVPSIRKVLILHTEVNFSHTEAAAVICCFILHTFSIKFEFSLK